MSLFNFNAWLRKRRERAFGSALADIARRHAAANATSTGLLVVSHDAFPAGAQKLLLSVLAEWKRRRTFDIKIVLVGDGALRSEFEALFPTLTLADHSGSDRDRKLLDFIDSPFRAIYSNTVVNGPLLDDLRGLGVPIVSHCHELQASIERWAAGEIMATTLVNSDFMIAAAEVIAENLHVRHCVPRERLDVVFASIDFWNTDAAPTDSELHSLRADLGIQADDLVVFGCGTTDWRKGPDLFLESALIACAAHSALKFIWIGGDSISTEFAQKISTAGFSNRIFFVGSKANARRYFYTGHLFALSSREDPCALVALEAANAELPVICFADAGDIPNVLGNESGAVVPFEDTAAFARAILALAKDTEARKRAGRAGREKVQKNHSASSSALSIERCIDNAAKLPKKWLGRSAIAPLVSVIVPNYNHERFLSERLKSVAGQTFQSIEIVLMDDASTDDSKAILNSFASTESRATTDYNERNSGSTFKQWRKALSKAQGKYIWIAESDDAAHPTLLERAVAALESDRSLSLAHVQSSMIDLDGKRLGKPDGWVNDLAPGRWNSDFKSRGIDEVRRFLSQKNTIPNASAVVFRNFSGIEYLVDDGMRLCADWLFWIRLLARGDYAFIAAELNFWRQNSSNARTRTPGVLEWEEGRLVLREAAAILSLDEDERNSILESFRRRCVEWSGGSLEIRLP